MVAYVQFFVLFSYDFRILLSFSLLVPLQAEKKICTSDASLSSPA